MEQQLKKYGNKMIKTNTYGTSNKKVPIYSNHQWIIDTTHIIKINNKDKFDQC